MRTRYAASLLGRHVKPVIVVPIHAEKASETLVDLDFVSLERKRFTINRQEALFSLKFNAVRVALKVMLLYSAL